jgi:hypothetical protein
LKLALANRRARNLSQACHIYELPLAQNNTSQKQNPLRARRAISPGTKIGTNLKGEHMLTSKKTSSAQPKKARATKMSTPTREEIALRAYHIYLERQGVPGNAFEDWTRAERELVENSSKPSRKPAPKSKAA